MEGMESHSTTVSHQDLPKCSAQSLLPSAAALRQILGKCTRSQTNQTFQPVALQRARQLCAALPVQATQLINSLLINSELSHQEFIQPVIIYKVIIAKQSQLNTIPYSLLFKHYNVKLIGTCLLMNVKYFKSCTIKLTTGMLFSKHRRMNCFIPWEEPSLWNWCGMGAFWAQISSKRALLQ